jgi:hypothetical protein
VEHDVLVLRRWLLLIVELAELERCSVRLIDAEAAGHAEMHDEHLAVIEPGEQIFGAPVERIDRAPRKRSAKCFGSGKRKSPRRCSTLAKLLPTRTGASPSLTVSTSGSSGMKCYRNAKRISVAAQQ